MSYNTPSDVRNSIGVRIKSAARRKFGNSRICAEKFGISPQTWSGYENGKSSFAIDDIYKLSKHLDVTPEWILFGNKKTPPEYGGAAADSLGVEISHQATEAVADKALFRVLSALIDLRRALRGNYELTDHYSDMLVSLSIEIENSVGCRSVPKFRVA